MKNFWSKGCKTLIALILLCQTIGMWNTAVASADSNSFGASPFVRTIAGKNVSYALDKAGQLWSWGMNKSREYSLLPQHEDQLSSLRIADIAGDSRTLTVLTVQGEVWLRNSQGTNKLDLQDITNIYAHANYAYAIQKNGNVWRWEDDQEGKTTAPSLIDGLPSPVVKIAASYALLSDGTVYDISYMNSAEKTGLTGIKDIIQGAEGCNLALKNDGTVIGWGYHWQPDGSWILTYGGGDYTNYNNPVTIKGLSGISQIAGGENHFAALTESGKVYVWGQNTKNQLASKENQSSVPTEVSGLPLISSLFGGSEALHNIVIDQQGKLWTWGNNKYGELGIASKVDDEMIPLRVAEPPSVQSAIGLYNMSMDGLASNEIQTWATDGKGGFLALTESQTLFSNDHGNSWQKAAPPTKTSLSTLYYAKDRYFLMPVNRTDPAYWTINGTDWQEVSQLPESISRGQVKWVNGDYVLIGEASLGAGTVVYISKDGVNWTLSAKVDGQFSQVYWNGSLYVGLGSGYKYYGKTTKRNQLVYDAKEGTKVELIVYTSSDLINWKQQSGIIDKSLNYRFVLNGVPETSGFPISQNSNGKFTFDGSSRKFSSADGITFISEPQPTSLTTNKIEMFSGPFSVKGRQLIFGTKWRGEGIMLSSSDSGKTWKKQAVKGIPFGMEVVWTGKQFVGFASESGLIAVSVNGIDWSMKRGPYPYANIDGIAKINGTYSAVGSEFQESVASVLRSKNGINWNSTWLGDRYSSSTPWMTSITAYGAKFIAVGSNRVWTSKDGSSWSQTNSFDSSVRLQQVTTDGSRLYAIGSKGISSFLSVSADGKSWSNVLNKGAEFQGIAIQGKKIAISGYQGKNAVLYSTADGGRNWSTMSIPTKGDSFLNPITVQWVNNSFVAIGDFIYNSTDGIHWTRDSSPLATLIEAEPRSYGYGHMTWSGSSSWYVASGNVFAVADKNGQWSVYHTGYNAENSVRGVIPFGTGVLAYGKEGLLLRITPN
ncbi:hypothetical protein [Paenibacillus sp. FSL K6-2524]|uniref:hypothetical protein n=1 Tax=Paenibacillus sp. FSL K6-2524 TaxID=2954516 RepID=UPI0030F86CA0